MKKAISLFIITCIAVMSLSIKAYAAVDSFSYNYTNFYSTYYGLTASLEIGDPDAYGIEIYIPESTGHEFEQGNIDSYIAFIDVDNNTLLSINFIDISGVKIGGWYTFDFEALGITDNVAEIYMVIMSNYGSQPPSQFVSYMATDTQVIYNYDFDYVLYWNIIYLANNVYAVRAARAIPNDIQSLQIYIPESEYHRGVYIGYNAIIEFSHDEGNTYAYSYNLKDFLFSVFKIQGILDFNLTEIYNEYNITSPFTNFKITIPQSFTPPLPAGYIDYLNENSYMSFNNNIYSYRFYVDGVIYDGGTFRSTIPLPTQPFKAGYYFNGWRLSNGETYEPDTNVDLNLLLNNNIDLYASWRETNPIDTSTTDPTANQTILNVFASFNLDTNVGFIIVYLGVIMIAIFFFNKFNLPNIMTIISLLLITIFWMFIGMLPILMSIMAFIVLAYMLVSNIRGGVNE